MKRMNYWLMGVLAVGATVLAGCASTELKSTWRSPDDQGAPVKKVAVFMLNPDENLRRFAEDQVVRKMPRGTTAVAGYALFDKPEPDVATVRSTLAAQGFDAILMARNVSVESSQQHIPPSTQMVPTAPILVGPVTSVAADGKTLDSYYRYVWGYTYQRTPGYTANLTTIVVETVLYRLPSGAAVWSAVSETRNPESKADMVQELVRLIDKELLKAGLLVKS